MATSGNIDSSLASWLTLRINWVVNSQSIANNTSNVTVKVQLITGNGSISSTASKAIKVSINGTTYSSTTTIGIEKNTTKTLYTKTVDVPHNSDGTKSLALNCTLTFDATISGSWWSDKYISGTAALNTIARASTFTRSGSAAMGSAQTIKITRKNSSFTHTLKYTWAGTTTTIVSKTTATSYSWTPPVTMAAKIPNATSGFCTLTCETYNGTTLVGSATLSFALSVPSSVVPTVSAFTLTEAVTGLAAQFGAYVDSKSKIKFAVTAAGAQSSTIKSYSVTIAGQNFTAASGTTKEINVGLDANTNANAVTQTAKVTVTDSRGRTASKTVNFSVLPYAPPTITALSAQRCDYDGTLNDSGVYFKLTYAAKIAAMNNKNSKSFALKSKQTASSSYTTMITYDGDYVFSATETVIKSYAFSTEYAYHVQLEAADFFTSVTNTVEISTASPTFDVHHTGRGMAIGKVSELENVLDIGYQTRLYGGMLQRVLEAGTDLNNATTPNTYTLKNANAANYSNCPILSGTGILRVESAGEDGQVRQVITVCSKTNPLEYERFYYQGEWGAWKRNFEVELYNNTSGSTGAITLSESVANFKYIEIFFSDNNNKNGGYTKIYSPNGKTLSLSIIEAGGATDTYIRRTAYTVSETTLTPTTTTATYVRVSGNAGTGESGSVKHASATSNYIKILRVVGIE